jgi:hypothetical protein
MMSHLGEGPHDGGAGAELRPQPGQSAARDAALRRTRGMIAGVAAGAVGLSGLLSAVAAHAFKGHPQRVATTTRTNSAPSSQVRVPGPQAVPSIAGEPAPLQPPAQPPAASTQPTPAPAPEPQVSGGS